MSSIVLLTLWYGAEALGHHYRLHLKGRKWHQTVSGEDFPYISQMLKYHKLRVTKQPGLR